MRALDGLGPRPDALEAHVRARRSSPPRRARCACIASTCSRMQREARARVDAVVAHLLLVPAGADAEQQRARRRAGRRSPPPWRSAIGSCWATRQMPVPIRMRLGRRGGGVQRDERVEHARVLARQLAAGRVRRARGSPGCGCARGRRPTRSRASSARRASHAGVDGLVGREHREAEVHEPDVPVRAARRRSAGRAAGARSAPRSPGATSMCCVATCASRKRRCSGLDS